MRVTIEHRETTTGLLANHKECFIDCKVEFGEEERAIIKQRDLYRQGFTIRTSTPPVSFTKFWGTNIMRFIGGLMMVFGVGYGVIFEGFGRANTNIGAPAFFIGAALFVYGWFRTRKEDKRMATEEQEITIKQLLNKPSFTMHAWNPAAAKGLEIELRDQLTSLKSIIQNSAELRSKQSFEL